MNAMPGGRTILFASSILMGSAGQGAPGVAAVTGPIAPAGWHGETEEKFDDSSSNGNLVTTGGHSYSVQLFGVDQAAEATAFSNTLVTEHKDNPGLWTCTRTTATTFSNARLDSDFHVTRGSLEFTPADSGDYGAGVLIDYDFSAHSVQSGTLFDPAYVDLFLIACPPEDSTFGGQSQAGWNICGTAPPGWITLTEADYNGCGFEAVTWSLAIDPDALGRLTTTTTITSDAPDPSTAGQSVTVEYVAAELVKGLPTVDGDTPTGTPGISDNTPSGTVTVTDGVDSCTGTVLAGQCSIILTTVGNRTLTATYAGDLNFNGSTSGGVQHTVNPANQAPTASLTNGRCSSTERAGGTANITLFDPDGDPLSFTLALNTNPDLLPNANIVVLGSGNNRSVEVIAVAKKNGSAALTFDVNDGHVTVPFEITVIIGTDENESLAGTTGTDVIFGLQGRDSINGDADNDLLCGGNGNDILVGDDGNDVIDGESGNDSLSGGSGNDILRGSLGGDLLTGGPGADAFSGGPGIDRATDFNGALGDVSDGSIP